MVKAKKRYQPKKTLMSSLLTFCRLLRRAEIDITTGKVLDTYKSLDFIDISNREDFYNSLKTNLTSSKREIEIFDVLFDAFWRQISESQEEQETPGEEDQEGQDTSESPDEEMGACSDGKPDDSSDREATSTVEEEIAIGDDDQSGSQDDLEKKLQELKVATYSPDEVLMRKDFNDFVEEEVKDFRKIVAQLGNKLATKLSRRRKLFTKSRLIDLRRAFRKNIKYGGDILELPRSRKKIKKNKIVLFCDVSGSMDCYSKFLIQFIHTFQNQISGVETMVFSTRMTRITELLKRKGVQESLDHIANVVFDWSGGTNIGHCLSTLLNRYSGTMLNNKTVVIIISDGWDRGDTELLEKEMKKLQRKSAKVIWLNPLLGSPDYKPICKGMTAALPHVDLFLPAHNLESLIALGKTLRPIFA